jgi:hypothetical protein
MITGYYKPFLLKRMAFLIAFVIASNPIKDETQSEKLNNHRRPSNGRGQKFMACYRYERGTIR